MNAIVGGAVSDLRPSLEAYAFSRMGQIEDARALVQEALDTAEATSTESNLPMAVRLTTRVIEAASSWSAGGIREASAPEVGEAMEAMESLNELHRAVLVWHYLGGMSAESVGAALGVSRRAAKRIIVLAIRQLADILQPDSA